MGGDRGQQPFSWNHPLLSSLDFCQEKDGLPMVGYFGLLRVRYRYLMLIFKGWFLSERFKHVGHLDPWTSSLWSLMKTKQALHRLSIRQTKRNTNMPACRLTQVYLQLFQHSLVAKPWMRFYRGDKIHQTEWGILRLLHSRTIVFWQLAHKHQVVLLAISLLGCVFPEMFLLFWVPDGENHQHQHNEFKQKDELLCSLLK